MVSKTFLIVIFCSLSIFAQNKSDELNLSGSLYNDSYLLSAEQAPFQKINVMPQQGAKKSPMLAGVMSLLVPGAGELYTGEYLKAAIFAAVEVAVITIGLTYDSKGDNQTEKFEKFANENWDVKKYAEWTVANLQNPESIIYDETFSADEVPNLFNNDGSVNWAQLHVLEGIVGRNNPKYSYSHHLPTYGDQQYYELIGKYPQYAAGWSDFNWNVQDGGETDYHNISPNFTYYSGERGKANDYYNIAAKAVVGIYINHFLSMLDAIWSSITYNKNIALNFRVETNGYAKNAEYVPTVNFKMSF